MRADSSGGHEGAENYWWQVMKEASASFLGTVTEAVRGDLFRVALDRGPIIGSPVAPPERIDG